MDLGRIKKHKERPWVESTVLSRMLEQLDVQTVYKHKLTTGFKDAMFRLIGIILGYHPPRIPFGYQF